MRSSRENIEMRTLSRMGLRLGVRSIKPSMAVRMFWVVNLKVNRPKPYPFPAGFRRKSTKDGCWEKSREVEYDEMELSIAGVEEES